MFTTPKCPKCCLSDTSLLSSHVMAANASFQFRSLLHTLCQLVLNFSLERQQIIIVTIITIIHPIPVFQSLNRDTALATAAIYQAMFGEEDGTVGATFQVPPTHKPLSRNTQNSHLTPACANSWWWRR